MLSRPFSPLKLFFRVVKKAQILMGNPEPLRGASHRRPSL